MIRRWFRKQSFLDDQWSRRLDLFIGTLAISEVLLLAGAYYWLVEKLT
ncbi:hypothetical protein LCGC14_1600980 [marine sediment metagenome]|uniref:Uncharacterized protein n=1 Tax=marine sediment metagenome TaxID=412755 RepID=A0A0F9IBJ1_9ZZZZ